MKPEFLSVKNFGPFYGVHSVDFGALGDFFLICGETGAGKTTLFDAMSYAFYGDAPGGRKGMARQMRCQYAGSEEESYAELVFLLGAEKWRIRRTLPYETISKRTKKTTEIAEQVSLEKMRGGAWQSETCANKSETDGRILSLVKLSADEFARIVLLPQGEFSRFLRQNSAERQQILAKLFPVSLYREAAERAREKTRTLEAAVAGTEKQIQNLRGEFNPETFESESLALETKLAHLKTEYAEYQKTLLEQSSLLETAGRIAKRAGELKTAESEYEAEITGKRELHEQRMRRLADADRAYPVASLIAQHKAARADLQKNSGSLQEKKTELLAAEKICAELEAERGTFGEAKEKLNALIQRQPAIESAIEAAEKAEEAARALQTAETNAQKAGAEHRSISVALEKCEAELREITEEKPELDVLTEEKARARNDSEKTARKKQATAEYFLKKESLEKTKLRIESLEADRGKNEAKIAELDEKRASLQKEAEAKRNADMAALLASSLKENEPCPVCGSVHHPAPNAGATESLAGISVHEKKIAEIDGEKKNLEKAGKEIAEALSEARAEYLAGTAYLKKQEDADEVFPSVEEAERRQAQADAQKEKAEKAFDEGKKRSETINILSAQKDRLGKSLSEKERTKLEAEQRAELLRLEIKNSAARFSEVFPGAKIRAERARDALRLCRAETKRLQDFISGFEAKDKNAFTEKSKCEGAVKELEGVCAALSRKLEESGKALEDGCAAAGFRDCAEAEAALMEQAQKRMLAEEISDFESRKSSLESRILFLKRELENDTAQMHLPDQKTLEAEYARTSALLEENKNTSQETAAELAALKEKAGRWRTLVQEHGENTKTLGTLKAVSDDLLGSNPRKIKFEAWILRHYLEEVTEYANARISKMSEGRYRIQTAGDVRRGNAMTGLDLEIFDSYTGKTRPTGTLSGGETFMASISLALGLADSIQARAGGIQLEAMFIDEGFGSLDESCLELAMNIFDEIRGRRTVGIISHVKELQSRIPQRLEVRKNAAAGSRIIQE